MAIFRTLVGGEGEVVINRELFVGDIWFLRTKEMSISSGLGRAVVSVSLNRVMNFSVPSVTHTH